MLTCSAAVLSSVGAFRRVGGKTSVIDFVDGMGGRVPAVSYFDFTARRVRLALVQRRRRRRRRVRNSVGDRDRPLTKTSRRTHARTHTSERGRIRFYFFFHILQPATATLNLVVVDDEIRSPFVCDCYYIRLEPLLPAGHTGARTAYGRTRLSHHEQRECLPRGRRCHARAEFSSSSKSTT